MPGLIEGASEGRGLGHEFLRHVERCAALVHVIDCATLEPGRDPLTDLDVIEAELRGVRRARGPAASGRAEQDRRARRRGSSPRWCTADLEARGCEVFAVSAATHEGLRELTFAMAELVAGSRTAKPDVARRPGSCCGPPATTDDEFTIRQVDGAWRVRGEKPERWVRQTDFANDEAVGYLADRLNRLGVEERLLELGRQVGDDVVIGDDDNAVVFDFDPQVQAGAENLASARRGPGPAGSTAPTSQPMSVAGRSAPSSATGARESRRSAARDDRVVVKVGSSSLTTADGGIDDERLDALVDALAERTRPGTRDRAGLLGRDRRRARAAGPAHAVRVTSPRQQAAASVGQGLLMHRYTEAFARHGIRVGQVLLTVDDVTRRGHYRNAYRTFAKLLELGVVPVVNENDTVATTEIRFGDNDRLAALVAHLVHADALVLLSDVDGLYDRDPRDRGRDDPRGVRGDDEMRERGRPPRRRRSAPAAWRPSWTPPGSRPARASRSSSAAAEQVGAVLAGERVGTWFAPTGKRRSTRLLWLGHATEAAGLARARRRGRARGDDRAGVAVAGRRRRRSTGTFVAGDPVDLVDEAGSGHRPRLGQLRRGRGAGAARPHHEGARGRAGRGVRA